MNGTVNVAPAVVNPAVAHLPSCAVCLHPMPEQSCPRCGCMVRLKKRCRKPAVYTAR